jgi:hypothetical protein
MRATLRYVSKDGELANADRRAYSKANLKEFTQIKKTDGKN